MTDSDKLLTLALWFDERDARYSIRNSEVQDDLRRIAQEIAKRDEEIAALKDTITSLRVHLAVIREYVKDKVGFALEDK